MKKVILALIIFWVSTVLPVKAQELNCTVDVISQQIQGIDPSVFQEMKSYIFDFMNNRKWTKDVFGVQERIKCSVTLTLTNGDLSSNTYSGSIQITSSRPVYNTNYESPVLNLKDNDVSFQYLKGTQMNFNPDQFSNNLLSILGYYAYMIIGYDYDTFSLNGGTPYYEMAQRVVMSAQGASEKGWKAFQGDKNRYWLVDNILQETFSPLRQILYQYHRQGLDIMADKPVDGRKVIAQSLEKFRQIQQVKPMAYNTQVFFLAKSDEIVNLFTPASADVRDQVYKLVSLVDPGNLNKYQKIQNGK